MTDVSCNNVAGEFDEGWWVSLSGSREVMMFHWFSGRVQTEINRQKQQKGLAIIHFFLSPWSVIS